MISVSILGPLQAATDDEPLPITGRSERVVLAALAAFSRGGVSVHCLMDALWGAGPPKSGTKVLQNVVLRLRKSLGAEIIETRPGGYAVRAIVDSIEFEHLVHDGRALAIDGDWQAASSALWTAVEMWRGPPLPELCEWPLGRHEAARLDELGRLIREEHAETELMCGRHHEVVPDLEAMVSDEPLRERRWALLMLALHRSGRQAEALRAFQRARHAFQEVGLELGPDIVELDRAIGSRAPALRADGGWLAGHHRFAQSVGG
jgi:DNA-binding SARP family transcriptional activator